MIMRKLLLITSLFVLLGIYGCGNNTVESEPDADILALVDAKLKKEPKNSQLHYERAVALMKRDRITDAITSIKNAIRYDEDNVKYYILSADLHLRNAEVKQSYADLQKALELEPNSMEAYSKLGEISFFNRDYDRAIESIDKVIEMDPINAKAFFMRGFIYKETGDSTNAVRNFRKVIEIDPNYADAYEELGLLYAIHGNKLAIEYLTTALNLNPNNIQARYGLAMFYQDMGEYALAVEEYNKILLIDSTHANSLNNLGYIELLKDNYEQAIAFFDRALLTNSFFVEAIDNKGLAYELMNNPGKAKEMYQMALSIDPGYKNSQEGLKRIEK